jgi:CheY-like chemotaxis protein
MNSPNNRKVLIINDDPDMINLIRLLLQRKYDDQVIGIVGGREGLAKARETTPNLIILDIMMPDLDGYEVCRQLKATSGLQHIPVLFIAAKPRPDVYPVAQHLGAVGYLMEPFGPQELFTAYDAAMSGETYYTSLSEGGERDPK